MNKKVLITLALILLVSGAISFSLLTRGQSWLDDFAEYVMQAQSLVHQTRGDFIRANTFTLDNSSYPPGPVAYPWGFPLMLAPIYALAGTNTLAMQLVNTFRYLLFLASFFGLARTRLKDMQALVLTGVLAFNPVLLSAHAQIISDIPFLFFSTLGIFLIDRFAGQKAPVWAGFAIGAAIFMASFTRTNGALLLVPLGVAQIGALRRQPQAAEAVADGLAGKLVPYLVFGGLYLAQALVFPNGQGSYLSHFSLFTPQGLWDNLVYYLWLPSATFDGLPAGIVLYPLLLVFALINTLRPVGRDLPLYAYSLATLAVFIIWPERQGLRFIYPILPFLFLFAFMGLNMVVARLNAAWQKPAGMSAIGFWVVLALVSLWVSIDLGRANLAGNRSITGPFDPVSAEMFKFLRENTPADSVVVFFRPRAMRLMSGRDAFITDDCSQLAKGNYLALSRKVEANGLIPLQELTQCPGVGLKSVFENRRFVVYEIGK